MTLHKRKPFVKVYQGYGHKENMVVYGHVFRREPRGFRKPNHKLFANLIQLIRLFFVKPLPSVRLRLYFNDQVVDGHAEDDGFFKFEWSCKQHIDAGWHAVSVAVINENNAELARSDGSVFVPHVTQFAFISDIDDTVMRSFSATVFRRLYEMLARSPQKRRIFIETVQHYELLSLAGTSKAMPNPLFYVSSSEWNLYDYLSSIFQYNQLPQGIFLLNQLKRWYQLFSSGKDGHEGKLVRIARILQAFPRQKFILLGDNSQKDPQIYAAIAHRHHQQIYAVYIRNVRASRQQVTLDLLLDLEKKGIHTCLFEHSGDAIAHGRRIGLIRDEKTLEA
jgi:phosphatidate phosphatase APP1